MGTNIFLPGHLRAILNKLSINCVVDVGANRGDYAAMLRRVGFTGLIVSVEPLPELYHQLSKRAAKDNRWRVINFAAASENGTQQLNVSAASDLSSFLVMADEAPEIVLDSSVVRQELVTVRRLDEVLPAIVTSELENPRVFQLILWKKPLNEQV